jgi:CheY-like chemotaxis protein/HPt (histidine-containing phosphotransfer) domain-containing protein/anti-sigma regulatory factor (Ser/Thr protein kinase)
MIDLILTTETDSKKREYLETAKTSADSLKVIIDDILDYSKIETGQMTLIRNDFDLRFMLEETAAVMRIRTQEKNLGFAAEIGSEVPDSVNSDQKRLRQILDNILDNAVKFTEKGKIELFVCVEKNLDQDYLHFVVSDTGIGIPKEKQELIFKGFTQADGSVTRRYGGTGLGLAISKNLVEMMGGKIWLESRSCHEDQSTEGGSVFHFTIPLSVRQKQISPPVSHLSEDRRLRILLAEDNPFNQKLIDAILKTKGYDVTIADNGRIALKLFENHPFDLILMDIQMPELDGFQTARSIRSFEKQKGGYTPIIAITAYSTVGDKDKCLQAGMDEYLRKPIQREVLLSAILQYSGKKIAAKTIVSKPDAENRILNRKSLMEIVGNNAELVRELIRIYLDNLPKLMDQIEKGVMTGNHHDIQFGAHALKGMSYNISAKRVAQAAQTLEAIGRSEDISQAGPQYQKLKEEVAHLKIALEDIRISFE